MTSKHLESLENTSMPYLVTLENACSQTRTQTHTERKKKTPLQLNSKFSNLDNESP